MPETITIKNKVAQRILDGMEAGAEMTKGEWADELHVEERKIDRALTYLRKKGYLFYPLRPEKFGQQGKIVSILRKSSYIREVTERHDHNYLRPQLESAFRIIELAIPKYQELADEMGGRLEHLLRMIKGTQHKIAKIGR